MHFIAIIKAFDFNLKLKMCTLLWLDVRRQKVGHETHRDIDQMIHVGTAARFVSLFHAVPSAPPLPCSCSFGSELSVLRDRLLALEQFFFFIDTNVIVSHRQYFTVD